MISSLCADPLRPKVQGPFTSEQMLVSYLRHSLSDSSFVSGTSAVDGLLEGVYPRPPALSSFLPLMQLLDSARQGSAYQPNPAEEDPDSGKGTPSRGLSSVNETSVS